LHANNSILFDYIYVRSKDKSLGKNNGLLTAAQAQTMRTVRKSTVGELRGKIERENREFAGCYWKRRRKRKEEAAVVVDDWRLTACCDW
jgi:hypothetical protein